MDTDALDSTVGTEQDQEALHDVKAECAAAGAEQRWELLQNQHQHAQHPLQLPLCSGQKSIAPLKVLTKCIFFSEAMRGGLNVVAAIEDMHAARQARLLKSQRPPCCCSFTCDRMSGRTSRIRFAYGLLPAEDGCSEVDCSPTDSRQSLMVVISARNGGLRPLAMPLMAAPAAPSSDATADMKPIALGLDHHGR